MAVAIADGRYTLDRVAFQVLNQDGSEDSRFDFSLNPQSIQESTAVRTSYQNVYEWGSLQNYGMGQKTITIGGTTGWRHGLGFDEAWKLKEFLTNYVNNFPIGDGNNRKVLVFHNYTDNYSYRCDLEANGFSFTQDVSEPILVRYTIHLVVIGNQNVATAQDKTQTVIGTPGSGGTTNGSGMSAEVSQTIAQLAKDGR